MGISKCTDVYASCVNECTKEFTSTICAEHCKSVRFAKYTHTAQSSSTTCSGTVTSTSSGLSSCTATSTNSCNYTTCSSGSTVRHCYYSGTINF